jgi:phenylacetate-CoA ligase
MYEYAEIIRNYKPKQLFGYTSSIYLFAQFLKKNKIDMSKIGIKAVFVTAEVLHNFQRQVIQEVFGCPVANGYGGRDSGFIAHECPEGSMHITEDIYVEFIKEDGQPAKSGEQGEIVITHLESFGMPFIRYRTGDMGVPSEKVCSCGRGLPIIEKIEGRTTDFVVTPDGRMMHALGLIYILRDIEGIEKFKIIQKSADYLQIKITRNGKYLQAYEETIRDKIQKVMGGRVNIDFDYVDNIETEKSGKYKYVVSEVAGI